MNRTRPLILVVVNGPPEKTNGVRARTLFEGLSTYDVALFYRDDQKKLASTRAFYRAIARHKPDIIYIEQIGYAGVLAALAGKVFHGARVILSTGDAVYAFARTGMSKLKALAMGLMEIVALRMADAIVICGAPYHKEMLEERGYRNLFWIPGGVDSCLFKPMDVRSLREQLGLTGKLTVGVVGSINLNKKHQFCYGWEVLEVLRLLKGLPIVGVIVGVGDGVPFLKSKAREYGIEDQLVFTGWIEHDVLPQYINLIDVCISTQSNDLVGQVRITAKVPEYLACGRYVIASDVGGARAFVGASGFIVPYAGVKDLHYVDVVAQHLREICHDRSVLLRGGRGIDIAKRFFDYSVLRPELEKVIDSVQDGRPAPRSLS